MGTYLVYRCRTTLDELHLCKECDTSFTSQNRLELIIEGKLLVAIIQVVCIFTSIRVREGSKIRMHGLYYYVFHQKRYRNSHRELNLLYQAIGQFIQGYLYDNYYQDILRTNSFENQHRYVGMLYFFLCCVGWLLIFSQRNQDLFLK